MKNSIVIPTKDEPYIYKCLKSLPLAKGTEAVVVDDMLSSEDYSRKLRDYCKNHQGIRYVKNERPGLPANRNKGVEHSKGKNVFFIDADCLADKEWVSQMEKSLEKDDFVIGNVIYNKKKRRPFERIIQNSSNLLGANFGVRRKVAEEIKFDERFFFREETDFFLRLKKRGFTWTFNSDAKVYHKSSRYTIKKFILERKKYSGEVLFFKKDGKESHKLVPHLGRILYPQELLFIILIPLSLLSEFRLFLFPLFYIFPGLMYIKRDFKRKRWSFYIPDLIILIICIPLTMYVKRFAFWKGAFKYKFLVI